jgi:hypothetical protein
VYPGVTSVLPGAAVELERSLFLDGFVRGAVTAGIAFGRGRASSLGDLEVLLVAGAAGAVVCPLRGAFELCGGPRVRVAWAHASGTTERDDVHASDGSRGIAEVEVPIRPRLRLGGTWVAEAELSPTIPLRSIRLYADDDVVLGVHGVGLRVGAGFGYRF